MNKEEKPLKNEGSNTNSLENNENSAVDVVTQNDENIVTKKSKNLDSKKKKTHNSHFIRDSMCNNNNNSTVHTNSLQIQIKTQKRYN